MILLAPSRVPEAVVPHWLTSTRHCPYTGASYVAGGAAGWGAQLGSRPSTSAGVWLAIFSR
jgi:hypothetical protein